MLNCPFTVFYCINGQTLLTYAVQGVFVVVVIVDVEVGDGKAHHGGRRDVGLRRLEEPGMLQDGRQGGALLCPNLNDADFLKNSSRIYIR